MRMVTAIVYTDTIRIQAWDYNNIYTFVELVNTRPTSAKQIASFYHEHDVCAPFLSLCINLRVIWKNSMSVTHYNIFTLRVGFSYCFFQTQGGKCLMLNCTYRGLSDPMQLLSEYLPQFPVFLYYLAYWLLGNRATQT